MLEQKVNNSKSLTPHLLQIPPMTMILLQVALEMIISSAQITATPCLEGQGMTSFLVMNQTIMMQQPSIGCMETMVMISFSMFMDRQSCLAVQAMM